MKGIQAKNWEKVPVDQLQEKKAKLKGVSSRHTVDYTTGRKKFAQSAGGSALD